MRAALCGRVGMMPVLSPTASGLVVALALFLITFAVNLETPLYTEYARLGGFGTGITALVFAMYSVALLVVLVLFGGASDRVGRKPVLLLALGCAITATSVMLLVPTMLALLLARALQGIAVGVGVSAAAAYLAELYPHNAPRVAVYVGMMTALGFGTGALATSLALSQGMTLLPISYVGAVAVSLACWGLLWLVVGVPPVGGGLVRAPYFSPLVRLMGMALFMAWGVTGLVIAVLPSRLAAFGMAEWSGTALFLVNGTGALLQPYARRFDARRALRLGLLTVPTGYALLVAGAWIGALPLVLVGAALAGSGCYGFTYYGGLTSVTQHSQPADRARAVAGFLVLGYVGFALPSVIIGALADLVGTMPALAAFGVLIVLSSAFLWARLPSAST